MVGHPQPPTTLSAGLMLEAGRTDAGVATALLWARSGATSTQMGGEDQSTYDLKSSQAGRFPTSG